MLVLALPDEAATERLAARLARAARKGDVIALKGQLGSGKTTFARAFIRNRLGESVEVPSPTFTLAEIYGADSPLPIWHFDLYRLAGAEETRELGYEEALAEGVSLVEWPERLGSLLPAERLELIFAVVADSTARSVTVRASTSWRGRIEGLTRG